MALTASTARYLAIMEKMPVKMTKRQSPDPPGNSILNMSWIKPGMILLKGTKGKTACCKSYKTRPVPWVIKDANE